MTVGSSGTLYAEYGSTSQLIRTAVTFGWRIRRCCFAVEIRASIFNVPLAAIQVDESGFPALLKVRYALTDVASTLILPPLLSIGDEL